MERIIFVCALAAVAGAILARGISRLSRADRQFLAAIPYARHQNGSWRCVNFTYYGALTAFACTAGAALAAVLVCALGVPALVTLGIVGALLAVCLPAAKIVARIVEGNWNRFTVGGACFAGILASPIVVWATGKILPDARLEVVPVCAAFAAAYALGEGLGRLACLSYGCCYGRRLDSLSPRLRKIFAPFAVRFDGECKKAVYAGGTCAHAPLVPVQAMSAIVNTTLAVAATALLLAEMPRAALVVGIAGTQLWRFFSEFLRADDRGSGSISPYQKMSLVGCVWGIVAAFIFFDDYSTGTPDICAGLGIFRSAATLLGFQALFVVAALATGLSTMTASSARFFVRRDRI